MRFTRVRSLGRGSFGEVFLARDTVTGEAVALKVLHNRDPWALEAFKNEARLLHDVAHPALVAPDEVLVEDGALTLVMRYVEGRTFVAALAEAAGASGPLHDEPRVRRLVVALLEALAALHDHGVLHLDLKPANVRVTADDRIVVLDFGLSRMRDRGGPAVVGTPDTMAPEQLTLGPLGAATDLYAVGAMLFEAFTGRPPFPGHAAARVLCAAPAVASLRPIAEPWASAIDELLMRDPAARPSSDTLLTRLGHGPRVTVKRPAFVGRERELATLVALGSLDSGALVLVSGPGGSGKTTLVHRFAASARERGVTVVWGRAYAGEAIPFKALDAAIDQLCALVRADPEQAAALRMSPALPALAHAFPVFATLAPTPSHADPAAARELLHTIVARLGPTLLVVDDAHHGDADAADLLVSLVTRTRLMMVVIHRGGSTWSRSAFGRALEMHAGRGLPCEHARLELTPLAPPSPPSRAELRALASADADPAYVAALHLAAGDLAAAYPYALAAGTPDLLAAARRHHDSRALALCHAYALAEAGRAHEAAASWLELARGADARERRELMRAAGNVLLVVGAIDEGRALLDPLVASSVDAAERFDTGWPLARALAFVHPKDGFALLQRALGDAHASGDSARVALASGPLAGFMLGAMAKTRPLAEQWVAAIAQSGHPHAAALHALWSAFLAATRGDPARALTLGRQAIDALCAAPDLRWERFQAVSIVARSLLDLGRFRTMRALVEAHLPEARRVDDRYMCASLSAYVLVPTLAYGRVAEARASIADILARWHPGTWTAQAMYARFVGCLADLYEGDSAAAARSLSEGRARFVQGGGYRVIFQRLDHDVLEARIGLAHARWPTCLWTFERLVRRIAALPIPAGRAHAALLRACRANPERNLETAIARFDALEIVSEAEVARLRLAQLRDEPIAADAARARLREHGVADPDRWADVIAPGNFVGRA